MAITWVLDPSTGSYIQKYVPDNTSGKGVTVYRDGFGGVQKGAPPVNNAPFGRDGFGQPLKSKPKAESESAPYGRDGLGQPRTSPAPANDAPYGRDGFGQPLKAPAGGGNKNVLQGPGKYGPVGSADQAAGLLMEKLGIKLPGQQELDTYDPLGGLGSILKGILNGGGGGSGGGSRPTISSAVLRKALTSARKEIGSAYDNANAAVGSAFASNPYAGLQAQETVVDPGLSALFQSQGVSSNPLEQMLASNREAAGQRGAAMNDMYKMLAGQFGQQAAQQQANVSQQRAGSLDELLQNYAAIMGSGKVY